ncbi:hypothetical protein DFJ73DRAFT_784759 [Zopfochytrium polystomum]|nr:hypothetical protein DFJ73DRAFT_784759 [Zopfochytrium polystomum]
MSIAVSAATGRLGKIAVDILIDKKQPVIALVRDLTKVRAGVEACKFNHTSDVAARSRARRSQNADPGLPRRHPRRPLPSAQERRRRREGSRSDRDLAHFRRHALQALHAGKAVDSADVLLEEFGGQFAARLGLPRLLVEFMVSTEAAAHMYHILPTTMDDDDHDHDDDDGHYK